MIKKCVSAGVAICLLLCSTLPCLAAKTPVQTDAKAVILTDVNTGKVLYRQNENKRLYPASITKVMSLILVMEALESGKISLNDKVAASKNAVSFGGSQIWLKEGESMSVDDLLKAVVVASANDACTALGEYVAGSSEAFVEAMNEKAADLGLKNTHFENCTGLDEHEKNHYSTAFDIAVMSAQLMRYRIIQKYSTIWLDSLRNGETMLVNTNRLVRSFDGCIGLKTGTTTKAGFCVSAVAKRGDTCLCAVVLGSKTGESRFESAAKLLEYGFSNFESVAPAVDFSQAGAVKVIGAEKTQAAYALEQQKPMFTLKKGEKETVQTKITLREQVKAPVQKGDVLGEVSFYAGKTLLGRVNIVSTEQIDALNFWQALKMLWKSML